MELCSAESDVEGQAFLKEHFETTVVQRGVAASLQEAFKAMAPAPGLQHRDSSGSQDQPMQDALLARLRDSDATRPCVTG